MKCPRCNNAMERVEREGIRSNACPSCHGAWVSGGSLHELFAREEDTPRIEEALDTLMALDFEEGRLPCPTCSGRHLKLLEVEGVELDYCIGCKGLFFDPGELEHVFPNTYRGPPGVGTPGNSDEVNLFEIVITFFSGRDR